jgi:hypothetical protein
LLVRQPAGPERKDVVVLLAPSTRRGHDRAVQRRAVSRYHQRLVRIATVVNIAQRNHFPVGLAGVRKHYTSAAIDQPQRSIERVGRYCNKVFTSRSAPVAEPPCASRLNGEFTCNAVINKFSVLSNDCARVYFNHYCSVTLDRD